MDVEAYLRRIAYDGSLQPSPESLRALHRQHLFRVPFENIDVSLGTPIKLQPDLLYDKIVVRKRGGFCYELNGLFYTLLTALGFQVSMLSARVRREGGGFGPEFDHMLLKVELAEPWLADVGFGESFVDPLPLRAGAGGAEHGNFFGVTCASGEWELFRRDRDGNQVPLYRFLDVPRQMNHFEEMCVYHSTSPESGFIHRRICTLAAPSGRMTLAGPRLIVTSDGARNETLLQNEGELQSCLRDRFGIELDAATNWSRLMA